MKKEIIVLCLCALISFVLVLIYMSCDLEIKLGVVIGLLVSSIIAWKKGLKEFKSLNTINTVNNRLLNDINTMQKMSRRDNTLLRALTCKG